MGNVYSSILALFNEPSATTRTYTVPVGFKWVVRDVDAITLYGVGWAAANGFYISGPGGEYVWAMGPEKARRSVHYSWRGRQVFEPLDELVITSLDPDWLFRVSGYQLSLP